MPPGAAVYAERARRVWRGRHNDTAESSKRLQGAKESKCGGIQQAEGCAGF